VSVLILAREFDPTADRMVSVLGERGIEVFRVNTAWFPTRVQVSVELRDARWCGVLTAPRGRLDLDGVRAVWYRSPELSPAEAYHARVEAKYGLGGVLTWRCQVVG
jgi:MvdD-like protein with pre-ATP grasp domain